MKPTGIGAMPNALGQLPKSDAKDITSANG